MTVLLAVASAGLGSLGSLGGCAADDAELGSDPGAAPQIISAATGALTVGTTLLEGAVEQRFDDPADASRTLTISRAAPGRAPGDTWTVKRAINGEPLSETTFIREADGAVALVKTLEFSDRVATVFDPPLPVLPASISPGPQGQIVRQVAIKVTDLDRAGRDTGKPKASGKGSVTLTYLGAAPLPGGAANPAGQAAGQVAGQTEGRLITSKLVLNADPAVINTLNKTWYGLETPDGKPTGIIAEQQRTRVKVLGVQIKSADAMWVLRKAALPATETGTR